MRFDDTKSEDTPEFKKEGDKAADGDEESKTRTTPEARLLELNRIKRVIRKQSYSAQAGCTTNCGIMCSNHSELLTQRDLVGLARMPENSNDS